MCTSFSVAFCVCLCLCSFMYCMRIYVHKCVSGCLKSAYRVTLHVSAVWTISHLFACACDCRLAASQKAKRSPKPWNYLSCGSAPLKRFCAKSVKLFCSNTKFMCFVLWWYIGLSQYNYHWTLTSHLILFARNDLNRMYPNEQAAKLNYPCPRTAYVLRPVLSRTYT